MKATHEGHRGRLVGKVRGGSALYDHEILEALLFNACPRRDLNGTAHALLNAFGDLYGVMHASAEQLLTVDGVGENMAEYIVCLNAVLEKLHSSASFAVLKSTAEFIDFVRADSAARGGVIFCFTDKDGRVRRKLRIALRDGEQTPLKKFYTLLAVGRPYGVFACTVRERGDCLPTPLTDGDAESIYNAVMIYGVKLHDYCILGDGGESYSYFVHDRAMFGKMAKRG